MKERLLNKKRSTPLRKKDAPAQTSGRPPRTASVSSGVRTHGACACDGGQVSAAARTGGLEQDAADERVDELGRHPGLELDLARHQDVVRRENVMVRPRVTVLYLSILFFSLFFFSCFRPHPRLL